MSVSVADDVQARAAALLGSDIILACLIPLVLFIASVQFLGRPSLAGLRRLVREILHGAPRRPGHFSVPAAVLSYEQYARLAEGEAAAMQASYSRLGRAHRRIGYELGYTEKLGRLREGVQTNAQVTAGIAGLARAQFPEELRDWVGARGVRGDLGRVRESLKHFVRDWSGEGRKERARMFGPILDALLEVDAGKREAMRVLVPGSGLGRLAWEISELGFCTTANELSFFMNLAFRFLISETTTEQPCQHVVQPYASWFSHQRTNHTLFRAVSFPDVVPRLSDKFKVVERDFLSLYPPDAQNAANVPGYDFVVTLFFIDTSLNVIETIEQIHALLKPGGQWINLGPLLWTGGGQAALELSLEEVLRLVEMIGFQLQDGSQKTVECEYTADKTAMMKWLYQAEFWVATKV